MFPKEKLNQLEAGDNVELMAILPDESVDFVLTSPPFNVGKEYGAGFCDDRTMDEYHEHSRHVMNHLYRLCKSGARVVLEIGGSGRNMPLGFCWQDSAYHAGFKLFSEIVVDHRKTNPTAWGSYLKPDNVYTIPNFRMVYVFYKDTPTKTGTADAIDPKEWVEWTAGRWEFLWAKREKSPHPAAFPIPFVDRCLKLFGHQGDVVIDPYAGIGTVALVCSMTNRNYWGCDINPQYIEYAKSRIARDGGDMIGALMRVGQSRLTHQQT